MMQEDRSSTWSALWDCGRVKRGFGNCVPFDDCYEPSEIDYVRDNYRPSKLLKRAEVRLVCVDDMFRVVSSNDVSSAVLSTARPLISYRELRVTMSALTSTCDERFRRFLNIPSVIAHTFAIHEINCKSVVRNGIWHARLSPRLSMRKWMSEWALAHKCHLQNEACSAICISWLWQGKALQGVRTLWAGNASS